MHTTSDRRLFYNFAKWHNIAHGALAYSYTQAHAEYVYRTPSLDNSGQRTPSLLKVTAAKAKSTNLRGFLPRFVHEVCDYDATNMLEQVVEERNQFRLKHRLINGICVVTL